MKRLLTAATIVLVALYPGLIYFGLKSLGTVVIGGLLGVLFLLRFALFASSEKAGKWLPMSVALLGVILTVWASVADSPLLLRLYPVSVNVVLLAAFAYTLAHPPSMIEVFARISNPDLPQDAVRYTRKVTIVWCGFFLINGLIALWTALLAGIETWTLYNGLISYCAIGALVAGEVIFRRFLMQKRSKHGT
ncbi:MAG: hypothetical protein MUP90_13595 [Gammaproteobacteria bacterium]|nr:hypothetical protein [Gammaproteobacteria bacterium]